MGHYGNPAIDAAWERCIRDAEQGIVRRPYGVFRMTAEMHVLAERQGLNNDEAHKKLVECLRRHNVEWKDERYFPRNATIELIREAFAD